MFSLKKYGMRKTVFAAFTALGLCVASQLASAGEHWSLSNAPITYKLADPADMTGFHVAPRPQYVPPTMPVPRAAAPVPQAAAPQLQIPQVQVPNMPRPLGPNTSVPVPMASQLGAAIFDPSRVDQTLYPHQRIGKTYTVAGKSYTPRHQPRYDMVGTASWYGDKFHGKLTANGEKYDKNGMTAAHKTLPLNSLVVVTNLKTGTTVTLRVNDRGPFIGKRIIDLSEAAANIMGIKGSGLGEVRVQYAGPAAVNSLAAPKQFGSLTVAPQQHAMRPVAPNPAPVTPIRPHYQPHIQVPSTVPVPQGYQPLRSMGVTPQGPAPQTAQLQAPQLHIPDVMNPVSILPQAALPATPHGIPQAYIPPQPQGGADDTVVTMTISGPIHMAGHQVNGSQIYLVPSTHQPIK